MDNFIVSARKYRPSTFDTVVGQESITNTLKNAIKNNQLAQAFLFCGPRGVGKTSCARILAKTINCFNRTENIEACDNCESCNGFNKSNSFNIHELDAASNNGVDKIRELVDQVRFAPQVGKYNIYIIDEVHMLSQAAFNAFLKTLEEPPSHAIFILATTEKHKIIPTILSRCQIFDFKRIKIEDITTHLQFVAQSENIEADEDALHIIAQKADGALRDSLSIFDQIVSFCGNKLDYNSVVQNLNILDYDYFFKATENILQNHIPSSLALFDEILNNGFDGQNYLNGLAEHFRNLLVCKDHSTLKLLEVSQSIKEKYKKQSDLCSQSFLLFALDLCNKSDINYKSSKNQRLLVELTLMKLCGYGLESENSSEKKTFNVKVHKDSPKKTSDNTPINQNIEKEVEQKTISENNVFSNEIKKEKQIESKILKVETKRRTIAINSSVQKKENEIISSEEEIIKNFSSFNQDDLNKCWLDFQNNKEYASKHNFMTIVKSHPGKLQNDFSILVTLDNKVQEGVFLEDHLILLKHLKQSLNNDKIKLVIEIKELEQKDMIAYTDEDKFKKMASKNNTLNNLRDQFNLEIDY